MVRKVMWYNVSIPSPYGGEPSTYESVSRKLREERESLVEIIDKVRDRPIDLWFAQTDRGRSAAQMLEYIDKQLLSIRGSFMEYADWQNERNLHYEPKTHN